MKHIHILITDEETDYPDFESGLARVYELDVMKKPEQNGMPDIDARLSSIFLALGFPINVQGCKYLRECVRLVIQYPEYMKCVTKKLYPEIASQNGSTACNVERAIRHAIDVCWQRGHVERLNELYGIRMVSQADKPSNSELIALIADRIQRGREL